MARVIEMIGADQVNHLFALAGAPEISGGKGRAFSFGAQGFLLGRRQGGNQILADALGMGGRCQKPKDG